MTPIYKFYIQTEDNGEKTQVYPSYKDDLSVDYEKESGEQFFRVSLSGTMFFFRDDYDLIMSAPFDTIYKLYIEKSNDWGMTYEEYHKYKFMRTDCTISEDDKTIEVKMSSYDDYDDIINEMDSEYNLIELLPDMDSISIAKRPILQIYKEYDETINNFVGGGASFESDANVTGDPHALYTLYHFYPQIAVSQVTLTIAPGANYNVTGVYAGSLSSRISSDGGYIRIIFEGTLYANDNPDYKLIVSYYFTLDTGVQYLAIEAQTLSGTAVGSVVVPPQVAELRDYTGTMGEGNYYFTSFIRGIWARYLLDVENYRGGTTYPIEQIDVSTDTRNYTRVFPYNIKVISISTMFSDNPTQYGKTSLGKYYMKPYLPGNTAFYPVSQSTWNAYWSIWFSYFLADNELEKDGRKYYTLRDAYSFASCINVLLKEISPNITHKASEEYSQFLYGDKNPISGDKFYLYLTQKTNITAGEYTQPATKATVTLRTLTDFLKNVFQCYWYIEDNKFKIEYISFFENGGSYDAPEDIPAIKLNKRVVTRSNLPWDYQKNKYSFSKEDMPQKYQFAWADEVSESFTGLPIEIVSNYVEKGKIEEKNISNITTDVDYMLLKSSGISEDGFCAMAAIGANALLEDDSEQYPGFGGTSASASGNWVSSSPGYGIDTRYYGRSATLQFTSTGTNGTGYISGVTNNDTIVNITGFQMNGGAQRIKITIPANIKELVFRIQNGNMKAYVTGLFVDGAYELPFVELSANNARYFLQNGYLAFVDLQPKYWVYNMPAKRLRINNELTEAKMVAKNKNQEITFPAGEDDPNIYGFVKTGLGLGVIKKISISLTSRMAETTLKYDTE